MPSSLKLYQRITYTLLNKARIETVKNNPRAKEANTKLDFKLPLYHPHHPISPNFLFSSSSCYIARLSAHLVTLVSFSFFFSLLPSPSRSLSRDVERREKEEASALEGQKRGGGANQRGVRASNQRKREEEEGKGYGCARNGQPGIYTNSTRGIRRRRRKGGEMETIPRNFIGQPISGIIGNRWKSSFRRLCLLLASLD